MEKNKLTATVDGNRFYTVEQANGFLVDGEKVELDIIHIEENRYHLLVNQLSYEAILLKRDSSLKSFTFSINGQELDVRLEDQFDALVKSMGISASAGVKMNEIKAPMPGLILEILVNKGDEVKEGDAILVIEAMKMENKLVAPADAVVSNVLIKAQDKVDKNQILISFE